MRKICITLCLSLLTSLIHAAVMPAQLRVNQSHHQIVAAEQSVHDCNEVENHSQDTKSPQLCHTDSYQCCLGFVIIPLLVMDISTKSTTNLTQQYSILALKPIINFIYKPPKT
jgi:hypothetical protein